MTNLTTASTRRHFLGRLLASLAGLGVIAHPRRAGADTQTIEPFLGEIMPIAFNWAPRGWALCNGQLLPINQNQALFSIIGTTYGGNGQTSFALPNLQGRIPIHQGTGPGLTPRTLGQVGGATSHTLVVGEIPAHTHVGRGTSAAGTTVIPSAAVVLARNPAQIPEWGTATNVAMGAGAISDTGLGQPHDNRQPYIVVNYVIALQGVFPSP